MSVSINGSGAITYNDGSTQANSQVGMKNRIIDGGFIINQRTYVSNTALAAGVYAHDRWKAGAGGCTYTFTQGSLGVNIIVTITAGTLVQVIEGCNLAEGGTYVLSWTGTAQGRLNSGTYGASGSVVITGWTAGTNLNVEFNTGTLGSVQLEKGSTATSFDYRPYGTELQLCQRYCLVFAKGGAYLGYAAQVLATTNVQGVIPFPVTMRAVPSLTAITDYTGFTTYSASGVNIGVNGFTLATANSRPDNFFYNLTTSTASLVAGNCSLLSTGPTNVPIILSAEL